MANKFTIKEIAGNLDDTIDNIKQDAINKIRVSFPAIIQSFNSSEMTVDVKCAIKEKIKNYSNGMFEEVEIPLIRDVPVVFPSAGKYQLTFPISKGDECLVVFSDMCIDNWWAFGGIQKQAEIRRHDLSDAFCIPSKMSQVKKINNFNMNNLEIKNSVTEVKIEVKDDKILVHNVDVGKLKADYDNLVILHNQLREEFNILRNSYNNHKHNVTVSNVQVGDSEVAGNTGGPI